MTDNDILAYLNRTTIKNEELFDSLYFELTRSLYHYGYNFINPRESNKKKPKKLRKFIVEFLVNNFFSKITIPYILSKFNNKKDLIISNSSFNVNRHLNDLGFNIAKPLWMGFSWKPKEQILTDIDLYQQTLKIKSYLTIGNFNDLISNAFQDYLMLFRDKLTKFYSKFDIKALIVPYDVPFFENLHIKIFRDLDIPSFIFLHGLPGRYNLLDDNRSDYLIVWGELIKDFYISYGYKKDKIIVSGHPYYQNFKKKDLKFNFKKILILSKSIPGAIQRGKKEEYFDRSKSLLYLLKIKYILKKFNINNVRLRLHPSENPNWYKRYIDNDFFKIDGENLKNSLEKSSLVIGPSSTVLLESIYYGVNYVVFEPTNDNGNSIINEEIVPPFDGSVEGIPVAKNENQLENILAKKNKFDI